MIFLDIEVPEYQSMRTQEHKVPELLKALRGRGTIENNNEFDYNDRLHLSFTVNEENLAEFFKVYARFQTLCLIPMFNKNLKKKIYDSYMQYKKRTLSNMLVNVGADEIDAEQVVENAFNINSEENYSSVIESLGYKVRPNTNDCLMVYLESFSFKSIQDSSDGYELEMILWVCNDLTFYNSDEVDFLENYYKCFSSKSEAFQRIDEKINTMILGGNDTYGKGKVEDSISILFSNSYNEQKTYNPDKMFEKIETPISINIPNKYIAQVEVRAMNNLRRLPIVGKTKGFIQHLGKGEIGITVKLALNQKNALEEKIIHDIKSISLYQQEYITTSSSDFYLFKSMDIKELSMSTNIIEEPSDDVDITIVTIFFVGSSISKQELDNDYFHLMDRANTTVHLKLFNRFLNKVLNSEKAIDVNPNLKDSKETISTLSDDEILEQYCGMIISKADLSTTKKTQVSDPNTNYTGNYNVPQITVEENNSDFTLKTLIKSYKQTKFNLYMSQNIGNEDFTNDKLMNEGIELETGMIRGFGEYFINSDGVPYDSIFLNSVLYRIQRIAYYMKNNYVKSKTKDELDNIILEISDMDNRTQDDFLEHVFLRFLAEYFDAAKLTDIRQMIGMSVSNVFKIEVLNNFVLLIKRIMDDDFENYNLFSNYGFYNVKVIVDGKFNPKIKDSINRNIKICFKTMRDIMETDAFMNKIKDFMISNYYKNVEDQTFIGTLEKGIAVELEKAKQRVDNLISDLEDDNHYLYEVVEILLKLQILGCRVKDLGEISLIRNKNYEITTEVKVYLISLSVLSLFIADLNFEKTVVGSLAVSSATNFVGPFAVTYTALDTSLNEVTASIKQVTNGKTVDEYLKENTDDTQIEVQFVKDYKNKYDNLNTLINVFKQTFGDDYLEDLKKLNSTFIKTNSHIKDFQSIYGVKVFTDFDTPMSFLKKISCSMNKFKDVFDIANQDLKKLEDITNDIDIEKLLTSCLDNKKEDGTETTNNTGINISGNKEVNDLVTQVLSVFSPASFIADATINKFQPYAIQPTSFMQTELLGEFKLLRGLRSSTRLLNYQYERMMPDYEVFVIDEKYVERAMNRGYDYQDKIYSISNIISINIKKDDTTNLKHAIVRILNTTPHYIGLNTVFESQSAFSKNTLPEVVYSNKFVTDKLVFRSGMLINISIDQRSQFYDFTGKIDSVEITSNIITLRCSSFASELLAESFDMSNVYAEGLLTSGGTNLKNIARQFGISPDEISNSKTNNLNKHIIPEMYSDGLCGDDKKAGLVVAGATGILYTAIEKAGETVKHLDCPYNELILGRNLTKNVTGTKGKGVQNIDEYTAKTSGTTSHRISENINAVEYDLSFYGIQKADIVANTNYGPVTYGMNGTPMGKHETFIISHSSFIPKKIQSDVADKFDSISFSGGNAEKVSSNHITQTGSWRVDKIGDTHLFGYCYSYKRNDVKLFDVLNDITLRNPASYWDVFESGHYGTLFLGRNNYVISRKNKISSISREDVDEITNLAISMFNQNAENHRVIGNKFKHRYLATEDYIYTLKVFSELASFYDQNFNKDKNIYDRIEKKSQFNENTKKEFYRKNSVANKDLYNENTLASNTILAISGYNLISCSIQTKEDYVNAIDIKYKPTLGDRTDRFLDLLMGKSSKIRLKSFEGLPDERLRVKAVDPSLTTNLHTKEQAFEYAQSVMYKELRDYYSGKIVILYQPDIKKNDEVLLIDSRNKISGTVIVKDFEHILDVEAGAITIITPGMKVTTSSLMTDVYLTGILNRVTYEWLKMDSAKLTKTKINKINQEAADMLQTLYKDTFENINSIPIAFEYTGYNFEFDDDTAEKQQETGEVFLRTDGKVIKKGKTFDNVYQYKDPNIVITPRNISSLPFKLYPLIKNGKALIPDEDIYNSVERPFDFVTRLITTLRYSLQNTLDFGTNLRNFYYTFTDLLKELDTSQVGMYDRIISTYFQGFTDQYNGSFNDKDVLIQRLLYDSYYNLLLNDESKANVNPLFWDKNNIVFFNCKRLTAKDTDRIEKIAKILAQFTIVHVVELSEPDNKGEEFEVVKLLKEAMERYTSSLIAKKNRYCNEWTVVKQARLIPDDEVTSEYDDIGAVFINCGKTTANSIITGVGVIQVSADGKDSGIIDYDETPYGKTVTKKVIAYILKPHKATNSKLKVMQMFVFHNYYGKKLGNEAFSYYVRTKLIEEVLKYARTNKYITNTQSTNAIISGDFNLHIIDNKDELKTHLNANNEFYNSTEYGYYKTIRLTSTTTGGKLYDNFLIDSNVRGGLDYSDVIRFSDNYDVTYDISDHYPIYLSFKSGTYGIEILPYAENKKPETKKAGE